MFDSIAGDYDSLNHILSLDVDKIWRKKALKQIVDAPAPARVLDLACGTGDFSIAIAKALSRSHKRVGTPIEAHVKAPAKAPVEAPAKVPVEAQVTSTGFVTGDSGRSDLMTKGHVTGVDLSEGMLAVMREKVGKAGLADMISIEEGDGEALRSPAKWRSWPRCARPASAPSPTKPSPSASAACTPARNKKRRGIQVTEYQNNKECPGEESLTRTFLFSLILKELSATIVTSHRH